MGIYQKTYLVRIALFQKKKKKKPICKPISNQFFSMSLYSLHKEKKWIKFPSNLVYLCVFTFVEYGVENALKFV